MRITTLGRTGVSVDGSDVDWLKPHRRRVALLLYLALEREVARDKILALFWPDAFTDKARNSLNQLLYSLRKAVHDDVVTTHGDRLQIADAVTVDAHEFLVVAEAGRCADALRVYRGSFLRDVSLLDTAALEHWADQYRARITRRHRNACREELARLENTDLAEALDLAHEWADFEPEDDEAQHRYIALLIKAGRRTDALNRYAAYEKLLAADDLTPLDETREIIEQLRTAVPASPRALSAGTRGTARS